MPQTPPLVGIVDDDVSLRTALARWLRAVGCQAVAFAAAEVFLRADRQMSLDCLVLDLKLPGMNGVALLEHCSDVNALVHGSVVHHASAGG